MWQTYLGAGLTVFILGINAAFFCIIKFNDFSHLSKDLSEIKVDIKSMVKCQEELNARMVRQETKCIERHGRRRNKLS